MSVLYDEMDYDSLVSFRSEFMANYLKIKTGKDKSGELDLAQIEAELKLISKALTKVKVETPNAGSSNCIDKNLDKDIRDKVASIAEFGPSSDVATFLQNVAVVYDTLVKGNSDERVEIEFVRKCKLRLDNSYLTALNAHSTPITTYQQFVDYMDSKHQSKKSAYQYLETITDLEMKPDESYTDFALRAQIAVGRAATIVKNKWSKHVLDKNSSATEKEKQMSADDVIAVTVYQLVLQQIKRNKTVYNAIINDLDKTWTGMEIANKALSIADRQLDEIQSQPATVLHANTNVRQICYNFLLDQPCISSPCPYHHDLRLRKSIDRKTEHNQPKPIQPVQPPKAQPQQSGETKPKGKGKRNGKKSSSKTYQSTASTSDSANRTGQSSTSHHTQINPSQVMVFPHGPNQ